tara:strand:- start:565 stop:1080 length:516 start_codon:yes stop_codon:yes gene_type:complete
MKIINISTEKLTPYINNSRTHNDEQIEQIANSIREFGFTNPVLIDENNEVLAGHGRLKAAEFLELKSIPSIQITGLTEQQKKAYVIADNKLALNAVWDDEMLQKELSDLFAQDFDLSLLGWSENEITSFVGNSLENIIDEKDYIGAEEIEFEDIDNFQHVCPRCSFNFNDK